MRLPSPRGPLSTALIAALRTSDTDALADLVVPASDDPVADDDLQLALWVCCELHYRGFDEVPDDTEWDTSVIALRTRLETVLLDHLRAAVTVPASDEPVAVRLRRLVDGDKGRSVSRYIQTKATHDEIIEFAQQRSIYQLKEADPHTWAVPRLHGVAKAALVEVQVDEYGNGDVTRMHSELYRKMLRGLGLDDEYGAYIDAVPAVTLALSNVMSVFGLRRALRGAIVGHLAAYEMTSSEPCRRYARGFRRLGADDATCDFFDAHVMADALHEQVAAHDLCGGLAADEPALTEQILWGAAVCLHIDALWADHVLGRWEAGHTSLRGGDLDPVALPAAS